MTLAFSLTSLLTLNSFLHSLDRGHFQFLFYNGVSFQDKKEQGAAMAMTTDIDCFIITAHKEAGSCLWAGLKENVPSITEGRLFSA